MPNLCVYSRFGSDFLSEGPHHGQSVKIRFLRQVAENCNELFLLDFLAEERVYSHAQFTLCNRWVAESENLR